MGLPIDTGVSCIKTAWAFIKKEFKFLFIEFLKTYVLTYLAFIALGAVFLLFYFGSGQNNYVTLGIGIPLLIIGLLVSMVLGSVPYKILHERTKGKRISIIAEAKKIAIPVIKYQIIILAITMVILLPAIISVASGAAQSAICLIGLSYIGLIVIIFFIQFAIYELLINKKGAIESIKSSFSLVKKNIGAVFVYDIVLAIIIIVIYIFFLILNIIPILGIFLSLFIEPIILSIIMIPAAYFFWKRLIRNKK